MSLDDISASAQDLTEAVGQRLSLVQLTHHIKQRADGPYLVFEVTEPNERFFKVLREAQRALPEEHPFKERATVLPRAGKATSRLMLPETQLLRATLSESLTVDQYTFSDDFDSRYIRSVFGFEDQIVTEGNHIVYGRRGSGKSSLLAYAMHHRKKRSAPYAWVGMQAYAQRDDIQVSVDTLGSVVGQLLPFSQDGAALAEIQQSLEGLETLSDNDATRSLVRLLPKIGRAVLAVAASRGAVTLFVDDLHVVAPAAQSRLLGHLYSVARGNQCNLKVSAIEQFAQPWDSVHNIGLQVPHDAQVLKLDYNLTMPDKSKAHISSILDAHARFCGLPYVSYVCGEGVLSRLVWVAAAVPRDALNLFGQAIGKGSIRNHKLVSVTSVNEAASEMSTQKLRDMHQDRGNAPDETQAILERIKDFCVREQKKNAFLVEIVDQSPAFRAIQELIALRLVHVLHQSITPHEAGRRYQALLLDYGFYVGLRAAKSMDLFLKEPSTPKAQELRGLPIFDIATQGLPKTGRPSRRR